MTNKYDQLPLLATLWVFRISDRAWSLSHWDAHSTHDPARADYVLKVARQGYPGLIWVMAEHKPRKLTIHGANKRLVLLGQPKVDYDGRKVDYLRLVASNPALQA